MKSNISKHHYGGQLIMLRFLLFVTVILCCCTNCFATFSIIARTSDGEMGIAVASRVLAVGSQVGWAEADVGVVARQADLNMGYGPRALELLRSGMDAQKVLERLLAEHPSSSHQIAIIDAKGNIAVSTGPDALNWHGEKKGQDYSVQGNVLVGPQVIEAMARAFEQTKGPLPERLFTALKAGDDAGGDRRGRQSAYMLVVKKKGGFGVDNDRVVDIRVDDTSKPIPELRRLLNIQMAWNLAWAEGKPMSEGKFEEAKALAAQALAYVPDNSYFQFDMGFLSYLTGNRTEALHHFQKARQMDPLFTEVWNSYKLDPTLKPVFDDQKFVEQVFAK
jgi:uncharacterized Ntn-hydrolase superfamily protein